MVFSGVAQPRAFDESDEWDSQRVAGHRLAKGDIDDGEVKKNVKEKGKVSS